MRAMRTKQTTTVQKSHIMPTPTLLEHVVTSLHKSQHVLRVPDSDRHFEARLLSSEPRTSYSLLPWNSSVSQNKVKVQDYLLIVSEDGLPVFALEANLFTVASTQVKMLYISKVDTTGLVPNKASPAKTVAAACISWFLAFGGSKLRVHVFAKAAPVYLFPGSSENPAKKVLSDKQLAAWWKSVLSLASVDAVSLRPAETREEEGPLKGWYFVPTCEELETRRLLGFQGVDSKTLEWRYGHWLNTLPPVCSVPEGKAPQLGDMVPAFPDDPKSRFLTSLTSSRMSAAGETGDYEDACHVSGTLDPQLEEEREKEIGRLAKQGSASDFWERLSFRQECCSGILVAFFVVSNEERQGIKLSPLESAPPMLSHAAYTKLWSKFHNAEYSQKPEVKKSNASQTQTQAEPQESISDTTEKDEAIIIAENKLKIARNYKHWIEAVDKEIASSSETATAPWSASVTLAKGAAAEKRKAEDKPVTVMQLKPRKKAKPAPPA